MLVISAKDSRYIPEEIKIKVVIPFRCFCFSHNGYQFKNKFSQIQDLIITTIQSEFLYRSAALSAAVTIPLIIAELKPLCSIWFNPEIVHPLGVVTLSTSLSG